jgi:hypothetical protein
MSTSARARTAPYLGLFVAVGLAGLAMALPAVTGWDVHVRFFPPLHAAWDPRVGPGTLPALVVGGLATWQAVPFAQRLPWRRLLLATYAGGVAWLVALATVDGTAGMGRILGTRYEYLRTAGSITDLPHALATFVARIPFDGRPDDLPDANWPVHVAGHPPGALTFFVVLARVGLGRELAAGVVVTLIAASTAVAVMVALRRLGAEPAARCAAPFLVFGPAAVWQAVSADAMFAAVAAWGLAALAVAAGTGAPARSAAWSFLAGVLLGYAVMLSYGLPLLGLAALAVLVLARSWWPLPWAALGALAVVGAFTAYGFRYWEALPAIHDRYWSGVARNRPASYWWWGDLAALAVSAGPLAYAGLASVWTRSPEAVHAPQVTRVVRWLSGAGVAMVLVADASQMSKGEVERIWLPFVPWLLVATALLPERWRRVGLGLQVVLALAVQHLLDTGW